MHHWMAQPTRRLATLVVGVALASCVIGIGNELVQDDVPILTEDARIVDVASWPGYFMEPYWPAPYAADQYRPLTSVVLSAQYIAGAGSPVVVRIVSYALYAVLSVLVFALARRAIPEHSGGAAVAAVLFAAHPVHVEATALGVGQAELLVAIFTVVAVHRYLSRRLAAALTSRDWLVLCGSYAAAALSKEQGFLLPLFLVAAELLLLQGAWVQRGRALWRGYAALAGVGAALVVVRLLVLGGAAPQNVAEALQSRGFAERVLTALQLVPEWIRLLTWPSHLRLDYSPREFVASSGFGPPEAAGAIIIVVVGVLAVSARRRAPAVSFGILWTAIALAPVSNVIIATGVLIAERTLLLPSVGWMLVLGATVNFIIRNIPRTRRAVILAVTALAIAGVVRSTLRQREWRDGDALTRAAVRDSPRSWRAHANHADLLFRERRTAEARAAYTRAIVLAPSPWWIRHDFARRLYEIGDHDAALAQLGTSLAEYPDQPGVLRDAVAVLITLGRYREARDIAARMLDSGREVGDLARLARVADSAFSAGAPPGVIRMGLSAASPPVSRRP